jgi:hypothetical protein
MENQCWLLGYINRGLDEIANEDVDCIRLVVNKP